VGCCCGSSSSSSPSSICACSSRHVACLPPQVVATAKQQAEKALIKLHKRLVSTASLRDKLDTAAAADNPYLRPPEFQVLPAEAAPADTAAAAAADAAAASRAKASGQQPAAKVQKLMPILEGASQQAFSSVIGDAVPEELPEGGIQEYVGWTAVEAEGGLAAVKGAGAGCAACSTVVHVVHVCLVARLARPHLDSCSSMCSTCRHCHIQAPSSTPALLIWFLPQHNMHTCSCPKL
jgi:hypothetical protein